MAARFSLPGMWGHGYAEMIAGKPHWTGKVELQAERLLLPLKWKKPAKVFASSTSDFFHERLTDDDIDKLFAVMALCPHLTMQILTKRPERMRAYVTDAHTPRRVYEIICDMVLELGLDVVLIADPSHEAFAPPGPRVFLGAWPLQNVWLGTSVERQQEADQRRDYLRQVAAMGWTTFVSYEPALGAVDWAGWEFLQLLISGGESGPRARPSHPDWHRVARDFSAAHGIAYFFKQWGEWAPVYDRDVDDPDWRRCDVVKRETPRGQWLNINGMQGFHDARVVRVNRIGTAHTGAMLDGREHKAFPEARP